MTLKDADLTAFAGSDYHPKHDKPRLTGQLLRIYATMKDGKWRTLSEIEFFTADPQASISAQLRNLRKPPHNRIVEKRVRGDRKRGLYEYRLKP